MRKGSLKKKTGCLRCKRRHKRCDELKPKCSYCARWHLDCVWPDNALPESQFLGTSQSKNSGSTDKLDSEADHLQQVSLTTPDQSISGYDSSHNLLSQNPIEPSTVSRWLRDFFFASATASSVYDAAVSYPEIVRGWPEFAFLDKPACAAQLASWAESSIKRRENSMGTVSGLEFETLTISRLRRLVSPGIPVSEEILLAATVHFILSASDPLDQYQLRNMVEGFNVMVMSYGGIDAILQKARASTVLAVLHCDIFGSLLNAEQHFFVQLDKPERPQTLTDIYRARPSAIEISRYVAADVVEVFDEIALLLYFRQTSNQSRALSRDDENHLLLLAQWIEYRLGVLQSIYINDCSLSELVVFVLIILEQEIIADAATHSILISTLLNRLQISMSNFQTRPLESEPDSELIQTFTIWTSLIALAGAPLTPQRSWFADYIHNNLTYRYGPIQDWPESWDGDLRIELEQLIWHEKIAATYSFLCTEIRGHQQAHAFT